MAARAGWSPFHFHRAFRRVTGETPKQYTKRLRLEHAATRLVSGAIAQGVGKVYMYAQKAGLALAGHPFTRYLSTGPGLLTIEVGFRFADAAVAVHGGPYDQLGDTYPPWNAGWSRTASNPAARRGNIASPIRPSIPTLPADAPKSTGRWPDDPPRRRRVAGFVVFSLALIAVEALTGPVDAYMGVI